MVPLDLIKRRFRAISVGGGPRVGRRGPGWGVNHSGRLNLLPLPAVNMSEPVALKSYINRRSVEQLGEQIQGAAPDFPVGSFVKASMRGLGPLGFTHRTKHIAMALRRFLPSDVPSALSIIVDSLPDPLPDSDGMFSEHYWLWPLSDFVRDNATGCWEEAMRACYELTQRFSAEFAIRPQLERHPKRTLGRLLEWTKDPSQHVRRLCSEGTRPRLPWAGRLDLPRTPVAAILKSLRADPSRFVQKSVANHLNDLGKTDPDWLLRTAQQWSRTKSAHTQWIVKHALRTQIKSGEPRALEIIGYQPPKLKRVRLSISAKTVSIGRKLRVRAEIGNGARSPQRLLLDWVLHYARPTRDTYRKVFKGTTVELKPSECFECEKTFDMTPRSTRSLYPGQHRIELQANGEIVAGATFRLQA